MKDEQHEQHESFQSYSKIIIPEGIIGSIENFRNFDPHRIKHYKINADHVVLYMSEIDRLDAIQQYKSTLEAFKYEVDRGVRDETQAFKSFEFDDRYTKLYFHVYRSLFEIDSSAKMIELSIVEDILKYQLYSKKEPKITVIYIDVESKEHFLIKEYPI